MQPHLASTAFAFFTLLSMPFVGRASEVIIAPPAFAAEGGDASPESSELVRKAAEEGAQDAGAAIVPLQRSRPALDRVAATGRRCDTPKCLSELARETKADAAVFVAVTEISELEYQIDVVLSDGQHRAERRNDAFAVILADVRRIVALEVKSALATSKSPPPDGARPAGSETETGAPANGLTRDGLRPAVFWTSLGVTCVLAAGYATLEAVTAHRLSVIDESAPPPSGKIWDEAERSQLGARILLGLTAAGLATTTALFFFTDFKSGNAAKDAHQALHPEIAVGEDGVAIGLEGRF